MSYDFYRCTHFIFTNDYQNLKNMLHANSSLIHQMDSDNWTLLHHAAYFDNSRIVKLLIENGANVNAVTSYNSTPLHFISKTKGTLHLLQNNANIEVQNLSNVTPLISAVKCNDNKKMKTLLQYGANPFVVNEQHFAIDNKEQKNVIKKYQILWKFNDIWTLQKIHKINNIIYKYTYCMQWIPKEIIQEINMLLLS